MNCGLTHDASAVGFMVFTNAKLTPGQGVRIRVFLPSPGAEPKVVTGRVVRCETMSRAECDLWSEKVAIALDQPDPTLTDAALGMAALHSEIYGQSR